MWVTYSFWGPHTIGQGLYVCVFSINRLLFSMSSGSNGPSSQMMGSKRVNDMIYSALFAPKNLPKTSSIQRLQSAENSEQYMDVLLNWKQSHELGVIRHVIAAENLSETVKVIPCDRFIAKWILIGHKCRRCCPILCDYIVQEQNCYFENHYDPFQCDSVLDLDQLSSSDKFGGRY